MAYRRDSSDISDAQQVPKRICGAKNTKLKIRRRIEIMVTKTKIAALTAIAVLSASPAFAQAYSSGFGTGNSQQSYFDKDGQLHTGNMPQPQTAPHSQAAPQNHIAAHRRGPNAYGSIGPAGSRS
jgi:hypothetical protein